MPTKTPLSPVEIPSAVQALRLNVVAAVQLTKQASPIVVHKGKVNVVADVQSLKQSMPVVVNFGMLNVTLLVQLLNVALPAVNNSGSVNVVAAAQFIKHSAPADVSNGKVKVVADVQSLKHCWSAVVTAGKLYVITLALLPNADCPNVVHAPNEILTNAAFVNKPSCATVKTPFSVTVVNALQRLNAPAFFPPAMAVTQLISSSIFNSVADVRNKDCFNVMPAPPYKVTSSPVFDMAVKAVPFAGKLKKVFQAARLFAGRLPGV